ncbi:MAG: hypothetical protein QXW65_02155 [Candidatus Pacearchaeota archaeon]
MKTKNKHARIRQKPNQKINLGGKMDIKTKIEQDIQILKQKHPDYTGIEHKILTTEDGEVGLVEIIKDETSDGIKHETWCYEIRLDKEPKLLLHYKYNIGCNMKDGCKIGCGIVGD